MNFIINLANKSMHDVMNLIEYQELYFKEKGGGFAMTRQVGKGEYPRFHLYGERKNGNVMFKLHLDNKETLQEGFLDAMGFGDNDAIKAEAVRIQKILAH